MEEASEDLQFEVAFGESLLRRAPDDARTIEMMAHLYTQVGRMHEGLALDQKLVEIEPDNATAAYNLACSFALLERPDEAFGALHAACERGYADFDWMLKDPDLHSLRRDPRWAQLLARRLSNQP